MQPVSLGQFRELSQLTSEVLLRQPAALEPSPEPQTPPQWLAAGLPIAGGRSRGMGSVFDRGNRLTSRFVGRLCLLRHAEHPFASDYGVDAVAGKRAAWRNLVQGHSLDGRF